MSAQNAVNIANGPGSETMANMQVAMPKRQALDCPSLAQILSEPDASPPCLPARGVETLSADEQTSLFSSLQDAFKDSESGGDAGNGALKNIRVVLDKLWEYNSEYLVQAADVLANGSRSRELWSILSVDICWD